MGNPLALLELTRMLTAGSAERPRSPADHRCRWAEASKPCMPPGWPVCPKPAQTLLRVAAAEGVGDAATVLRAAALLGATQADLDVAESSGLIIADAGRLVFRHPLVRSATYQSATPAERRSLPSRHCRGADERG